MSQNDTQLGLYVSWVAVDCSEYMIFGCGGISGHLHFWAPPQLVLSTFSRFELGENYEPLVEPEPFQVTIVVHLL